MKMKNVVMVITGLIASQFMYGTNFIVTNEVMVNKGEVTPLVFYSPVWRGVIPGWRGVQYGKPVKDSSSTHHLLGMVISFVYGGPGDQKFYWVNFAQANIPVARLGVIVRIENGWCNVEFGNTKTTVIFEEIVDPHITEAR